MVRFSGKGGLKVPQIGWNSLKIEKDSKLLEGVSSGDYVYFVHSYYVDAADKGDVVATTGYGETADVAVAHDNVFGCQFHPEKSSAVGLKILKNFIDM